MAKKTTQTPDEGEQQRQSRKEILIARKQQRQLRGIRIAAIVIISLIAIVIAIAVVNELILTPQRAVATIGDQTITLRDWQNRVEYERAQRIVFLENQLEAFGGDVGIVQQFGGQVMSELLDPEGMGQNVLNVMADEVVICRAAEERGIVITDADVERRIGELFSYYGEGISPTPLPEPTETVAPTPSLTPIPTAVITDVVPTETPLPTATFGPTATPFPTPTAVPETYFREQYGEIIGQLSDLGVDESVYRSTIRAQICREKLGEALAEEQAISRVAPHASLFVIGADNEEEANELAQQVADGDFLTVWNTIRSRPVDPEATEQPGTFAFELLWRTREGIASSVGESVAAASFDQPLNEPSDLIVVENADGTTSYYIIMVSGREDRELSSSEYQTKVNQALQTFVDEQLTGNLQINEMWRSRVPTLPLLDNKFLVAPTAAPTVAPVATTVEEGGGE